MISGCAEEMNSRCLGHFICLKALANSSVKSDFPRQREFGTPQCSSQTSKQQVWPTLKTTTENTKQRLILHVHVVYNKNAATGVFRRESIISMIKVAGCQLGFVGITAIQRRRLYVFLFFLLFF